MTRPRALATGYLPTEKETEDSLDTHWKGVMVDRAPIAPDEHAGDRVPGWQCRSCGQVYGTSGLPPRQCKCGATWRHP